MPVFIYPLQEIDCKGPCLNKNKPLTQRTNNILKIYSSIIILLCRCKRVWLFHWTHTVDEGKKKTTFILKSTVQDTKWIRTCMFWCFKAQEDPQRYSMSICSGFIKVYCHELTKQQLMFNAGGTFLPSADTCLLSVTVPTATPPAPTYCCDPASLVTPSEPACQVEKNIKNKKYSEIMLPFTSESTSWQDKTEDCKPLLQSAV